MSRAALPGFLPCRSALLAAVTLALVILPAPAGANPAPDAIVYFNVKSAGPPEEYCVTDIIYCDDLDQSTEEQGLLEFQLFIEPQQWTHGVIPVWNFTTYLTWPETWALVDICYNAYWGGIDPQGPNSCYMGLVWDCWVPAGMFLAATLVFDVQGYGKLETNGDCELRLDCPQPFVVYPAAHFGEAGTACEYTDQHCMSWEPVCIPEFQDEQLVLTAPEGGTTHGELDFAVGGYHPWPCSFNVNSEAPWASGYVELTGDPYVYHGVLFVDADASGLEPGVYESEMQVAYDGGGTGRTARCVSVILTVEPASSVGGPVAADPAAAPLGLRLTGASPSSGPFVFAYESPTAAQVRCGVYDASGREVVPLTDGEQPGGPHTITWRATDAEGRRVRPGVYLVRLALDGQVRSSRVVVVR
jgi:hypothetical protein